MYRLFILGLALGLFAPSAGIAQEKKNDKADLTIEGKLTDDDPKDSLIKKSPHKVHAYQMKAKSIYVIDLKSKDFDSVLRLEDSTGKQLAINDDATADTLDSRIVYKAKKDDTCKIIATNLDGKAGAYTLTVRPGTEDDLLKADPFSALVGKPAPDIMGEFSYNGETRKLSDLKGRVVLIDFWAVWCGPCIATFPHLREWDSQFKKEGLEIVGVTTYYQVFDFDTKAGKLKRLISKAKDKDKDDKKDGEPEKTKLTTAEEHQMLKDFTAHYKLTHRIMVVNQENNAKAAKDYMVRGIPQAVLIDRQGIVRMVRVGSGPANAADLEEEMRILLAER